MINDQYKIMDVVVDGHLFEDAALRLHQDLNSCLSPADKHVKNYLDSSLDLKHHAMFSALYSRNDEFVACSGVYHREQWPLNSYRLLNRTYYNPRFRSKTSFAFFGTEYILPYQLKKMTAQIDFSFVSREGVNAAYLLKKLSKKAIFQNYSISNQYVQMVPNVYDAGSFQKILYLNRTNKKFEFIGCEKHEHIRLGPYSKVRL